MARRLRQLFAALLGGLLLLGWGAACAENQNILIQLQQGGSYRIWHAEGSSELDDDEIMALDAIATEGGSPQQATKLGPARSFRTPNGVVIELAQVVRDRSLLVDRDACGHLKTWHSDGALALSEDQATDLIMAALPGGGARVILDTERHAKSFITNIGIMVAIWKPRPVRK